jgi:PDDEXK-like uncharacterized protein DUF3799
MFDYERQNATLLDPEPAINAAIAKIPVAEYSSVVALSNSGMKDLAVSPLRYWYLHINPERPMREETPEMRFGTALHCLVLEGDAAFEQRYACKLDADDYPNCLVTIEDLRGWIRDKGGKPSGTRKSEVIQHAQAIDQSAPIWDVLEARHFAMNGGKTFFAKEEWVRLTNAAAALRREPKVQEILQSGECEVSVFVTDAATGIPLKARLDWLSASSCIADIKTFQQKRAGKSTDQTIADAIYYEGYYRQAFLYSTLHQRATGRERPLRYIMPFVESQPPHEVRIRELRPSSNGVANVYWQKSAIEVRHFCSVWATCMGEFGEKPWRRDVEVEPLLDEEMRGMVY